MANLDQKGASLSWTPTPSGFSTFSEQIYLYVVRQETTWVLAPRYSSSEKTINALPLDTVGKYSHSALLNKAIQNVNCWSYLCHKLSKWQGSQQSTLWNSVTSLPSFILSSNMYYVPVMNEALWYIQLQTIWLPILFIFNYYILLFLNKRKACPWRKI